MFIGEQIVFKHQKGPFFIFSGRKVRNNDVALNIDGISINEEGSTEFMGVILDNKLNWKKHIDYVSRKSSKGIGMISKAKKYLNGDSLVTLCYSFIYPYMCYCNLIWGSTYESNLNRLIMLQKRIIRIISGTRSKEHTDPLFEKLGLLKFTSLNNIWLENSCFVTTINRFLIFSMVILNQFKTFIIIIQEAVVVYMLDSLKLN